MAATAAQVKTECNLDKVAESRLTPHLIKGELAARRILTAAVYEAIVAEDDPYTDGDHSRLTSAEALLAGASALPFLGIKTAGDGVTRSTGQGDSRTELASAGQLELMAQVFRDQAMDLIRDYIPNPPEADQPVSGLNIGGIRLTAVGGDC